MSASRDGGATSVFRIEPANGHEVISISPMSQDGSVTITGPAPFWRRLWFVVSCIPRYLISGSVEVP